MSILRTTIPSFLAIAMAAITATPALAQLASTGADSSPVLSCFYECKPGPEIQGQPTYRQVTTLPIVNNGLFTEDVDVNFLDGNQNVIATTDVNLPPRDVDELAVCNTIEAITGAAPPRAGLIQIGNVAAAEEDRTSGVFSWIKNVNGKFFADRPEPYDGRVTGVAKSQCAYVASPEVKTPMRIAFEGAQVPIGAPILVEDTDDTPPAGQPDLVPIPDTNGFFCRLDGSGGLRVEIRNQGAAASGPTTTEVRFTSSGDVGVLSTPALAPGASTIGTVTIPPACYGPDCTFDIEADRGNVEAESNEVNNVVSDFCLG